MMLKSFAKEMNKEIAIFRVTTTVNASGFVEEALTEVAKKSCCLWSKAIAEKYFGNGLFGESVELVACLEVIDVKSSDKAEIDNVKYEIVSIEDIAYQGEVLLLGLKR